MRFDAADPETGGRLREARLEIKHVPKLGARAPREVAELVRDSVAAIVSTDPFDADVFAAAPRLRVIARVGVGTDSIDLGAATRAGVVVTATHGLNGETTADHTMALMLAALRRVTEHDTSVRFGEWERGGSLVPWELNGLTVGIIGHGRIGQAVARRLKGFDVRLLVVDPAITEPDGFELVHLDEMLQRADVVSLHLPLNAETTRLLGERELALMKPTAVLVNVARGKLVDEAALTAALAHRRLRAAALDVFPNEPQVPDELRKLPNVVLSPHIGGMSERSIAAMVRQATASVLDVLAGRPDPSNVVNPEVLDGHFASA